MSATATSDCLNAPGKVDLSAHPCFNRDQHHKSGRIHLPVAPRCNIQCNFCNRKFDCMNESRPGVTSTILKPQQAVDYLGHMLKKRPEIAVMGIAGPGDPFANPEETMETLRLTRANFPSMILCLATNGLGILPHVDELADLGVSHVTFTVNAIDPTVGAKIYAWARDGHRPLRGLDAATLLLERQLEAIEKVKSRGMIVKINSIIIPGINDQHIPLVAEKMGTMGVDIMNCMALVPVQGAAFEDLPAPDSTTVTRTRLLSGKHVPQMLHCARCRADAVGLIHETMSEDAMTTIQRFAKASLAKGAARPHIAVATMEGMLVNQHLGEAARFLIFREDTSTESGYKFVEVRKAPTPGAGPVRWHDLAATLSDCRAVLVNAAGPKPKEALEGHGLEVIEMEGLIEEGLKAVFSGEPLPANLQRRFTGCGSGESCRGTGTGCA